MALVLKSMTSNESVDHQNLSPGHNRAHDDEENKGESQKVGHKDFSHLNDEDWQRFCQTTLKAWETKWTKKLEDYDDVSEQKTEEHTHEINIGHDDDDDIGREENKDDQ